MQIRLQSGNFETLVSFDNIRDGEVNIGTAEKPKMVPAREVVLDCAATYLGQRDGWSGFYKGRLEDGAKRETLEFTEELAGEASKTQVGVLGQFFTNVDAVTTEHVSEGAAPSMKTAKSFWNGIKDTPVGAAYRTAFEGKSEDEIVTAIHAQLMADRKPRGKKAATQAAGDTATQE